MWETNYWQLNFWENNYWQGSGVTVLVAAGEPFQDLNPGLDTNIDYDLSDVFDVGPVDFNQALAIVVSLSPLLGLFVDYDLSQIFDIGPVDFNQSLTED